ncbi:hypothetical protein H0H87_009439 [Tephrocybe sp. NHM501043]|nr:hypothetical protein H0H87_009439 [Tephrocybe sp. NHM501043]
MAHLAFLALGLCVAGVFAFESRNSKRRARLPPGPPSLPIIGHLRLIPSAGQDTFFYELGQKYGDVVYLQVLNQSLIILNSAQAAFELMDRRGANYRNRPHLPIYEILGFGGTMAFLNDGDDYRTQRKMLQQYFSKEKVKDHLGIQIREACVLAQNLLSKPEDYAASFLRFSTAVIIDLTFGHQVVSDADPYLQIAEDCCALMNQTGPPGATVIDFFPICKLFFRHFPAWFPGTYYAELARKSSWKFLKLLEYPFEQVKKQMVQGTARPSFLATQLEDSRSEGLADNARHDKCIQNAAAIAYIAGAETTSSTLSFFLLAMVIYPECQARAQREIDSIIGRDRLPDFSDRESLPYLECVVQETARWNHAAPNGVPHKTLEDDIYNGMLIPKGSTVVANIRGITLDATVYKDATVFDPTRFMPAPEGRGEPYTSALFGFGRRKCPGRYLAEDSLWITIATILATARVARAVGKDGKEIIPGVISVASGITTLNLGQPQP